MQNHTDREPRSHPFIETKIEKNPDLQTTSRPTQFWSCLTTPEEFFYDALQNNAQHKISVGA
jgi:hypothetical protein